MIKELKRYWRDLGDMRIGIMFVLTIFLVSSFFVFWFNDIPNEEIPKGYKCGLSSPVIQFTNESIPATGCVLFDSHELSFWPLFVLSAIFLEVVFITLLIYLPKKEYKQGWWEHTIYFKFISLFITLSIYAVIVPVGWLLFYKLPKYIFKNATAIKGAVLILLICLGIVLLVILYLWLNKLIAQKVNNVKKNKFKPGQKVKIIDKDSTQYEKVATVSFYNSDGTIRLYKIPYNWEESQLESVGRRKND